MFFIKFSWQNLIQKKLWSVLIIFICSFFVGSYIGTNLMTESLEDGIVDWQKDIRGDADLTILSYDSKQQIPLSYGRSDFNESIQSTISSNLEVDSITKRRYDVTKIVNSNSSCIVVGIDPKNEGYFGSFEFVGSGSIDTLSSNFALITKDLAESKDLEVGYEFEIYTPNSGSNTKKFVVGGIVENEGKARIVNAIFIDLDLAQDIFDRENRVNMILVNLDSNVKNSKEKLQNELGPNYRVEDQRSSLSKFSETIEGYEFNYKLYNLVIFIFAFLIMFVIFLFFFNQDRDKFTLLKSYGAGRFNFLSIILFYTLFIVAFSFLFGSLLGILWGQSQLNFSYLTYIYGISGLKYSISSFILGFLILFCLAFFSISLSFLISQRNNFQKRHRSIFYGILLISILSLGAIFLVYFGLFIGQSGFYFALYLTLICSLIIFLFYLFLDKLSAIFSPIFNKIDKPISYFARINLKKRRSFATLAFCFSFILSAFYVNLSSINYSYSDSIDETLDSNYKGDIYLFVSPSVSLDKSFTDELKSEIDGIDLVSPISKKITKYRNDSLVLYGIDVKFSNVSDFEFISGSNNFSLDSKEIIINQKLADKKQKEVGNNISILTLDGYQDYQIVGIAKIFGELEYIGYISLDSMENDFENSNIDIFSIKISSDRDDVIDDINSSYNPQMGFYIVEKSQVKDGILSEVQGWFSSYYFLFILVLFMSIFILSSIYYNEIFYKKEDIKLILGVGGDQNSIFKLFLIQGLIISLSGWLFGVFSGFLISYLYLNPSYPFYFSFESIITSFLVIFLINLIVLYFVSKKASNFNF